MSTLALIHPTDLLAVELRASLERRRDLWRELRLLSTLPDEIGTLTDVRGEAAMVQELDEAGLDGVDVVLLCGPVGPNRPLLASLPEAATAVVLSPDATLDDGHPVVAGVNLETVARGQTLLSPHPGAVALAHLLHPLGPFTPRRVVATLLEPVSVLGKAALDEMFEQTRGILTFQSDPPREVFPTQMTFNVLPGETPAVHLAAHLGTILEGDPQVSVRILKTGVFHSYGVSLHLELADDPGREAVVAALGGHPMNEVAVDPELLGMVDAAARDEVLVGSVEADPARPGAYHLWAVIDNLTCGGARNAILILEALREQVIN